MCAEPLRRRELTLDEYLRGVRTRSLDVFPRAITLVESNARRHQLMAEQLLTELLPFAGGATRIGLTGVPGVGKSTLIEALGLYLIERGHRVAVLAVDPSSSVSGGSVLGDKTRMTRLSAATNAYIRPAAAAGTLGGVARKTRESMLICEAAGFDVVIIETVGVGQSETMVADMTDCFVALALPGAGDELQGIKRGLLELVDVIAVNKADGELRTAALVAAKQYERALASFAGRRESQMPTVLTCSALLGEGVDALWQSIAARQSRLIASGRLDERRRHQALRWMWSVVDDRLRQAVRSDPAVQAIREPLERQLLDGRLPPEAAARRILEAFGVDGDCCD